MDRRAQQRAFDLGADDLGVMDMLVYGHRIPPGLLYLLKSRPEHVETLTFVCHGQMQAAWIDFRLRPYLGTRLTVMPADNPWWLRSRRIGFCYDTTPLSRLDAMRAHVEAVLSYLNPECVCYFDLKGVEIEQVFASRGLTRMATLDGLTGFYRRASWKTSEPDRRSIQIRSADTSGGTGSTDGPAPSDPAAVTMSVAESPADRTSPAV